MKYFIYIYQGLIFFWTYYGICVILFNRNLNGTGNLIVKILLGATILAIILRHTIFNDLKRFELGRLDYLLMLLVILLFQVLFVK